MIKAGVDWGSSSFRAYRFDQHGELTDELSRPLGIREIKPASGEVFEQVLFDTLGHWLVEGDTVLLSGMITSRGGWQETPYLACPVDVSRVAREGVEKTVRAVQLRFLPGIKQEKPGPDVMRGEELQLLGASLTGERRVVVLPGTHSKWALLNGSVLDQFHTLMTGELFDVLLRQTLVGALGRSTDFHQTAFLAGVKQGFNTRTLVSDLFGLRSAVLLGHQEAGQLHSRLSGLLIGSEIREAQTLLPMPGTSADIPVALIGSDALCSLYETAFSCLGIQAARVSATAAIDGFRQVARQCRSDLTG